MKTSILFSAILLVASSSFAQTSVKNQSAVSEAGSVQSARWGTKATNETGAASATTVQSNAVANTENSAYKAEARGKKAAVAAKEQAKKDAVAAKHEATKAAAAEENASASASAGSTANASAGNTSVTRFIQRICSGRRGNGQPAAIAVKITSTSPRLWENIMCTNLVMFE